jgi:predicted lipoprotein
MLVKSRTALLALAVADAEVSRDSRSATLYQLPAKHALTIARRSNAVFERMTRA